MDSGVPDQSAKTVLITGGNSGIGLQSALAIAARGARVLLACRNPAKAAWAVQQVASVATMVEPRAVPLDLGDLGSVRACAAELLDDEMAIDVLMLNAGVMAMPRSWTVDGFEVHFGTNHLGHFALAGLLMPKVLTAPAPRVVTTASLAHRWGRVRWQDPNWNGRFYSSTLAYGQSKVANLLFMRELDRRARAADAKLISVAAHPGAAHTNLATQQDNLAVRWFYDFLRRYGTQSAEQGALPLLYAATMPGVRGGSYFGPDGLLELHGNPTNAVMSATARNATAAQRLWGLSERLTGVSWDVGRVSADEIRPTRDH